LGNCYIEKQKGWIDVDGLNTNSPTREKTKKDVGVNRNNPHQGQSTSNPPSTPPQTKAPGHRGEGGVPKSWEKKVGPTDTDGRAAPTLSDSWESKERKTISTGLIKKSKVERLE